MSTLIAITRTTLAKDMRLEWRSKDAINAMLFFSLLVVVIFSFAFDPTAEESRRIVGGLVWVLPVAGLVAALAGLVVAFRRWRSPSGAPTTPDDIAVAERARAAERA